jgi:hypothetical protein
MQGSVSVSLTYPIGLGIRSDVIDKERAANKDGDFIKIYGRRRLDINGLPLLQVTGHTEKHMKGLANPPSQEHEEWHPEKGKLDAQIDCTTLCQFRRDLRRGA